MKKHITKALALILALTLVLSMAGCGTAAASAKEEISASQGESAVAAGTTLTILASQDWIQDAEMELGEKFTEQTGIKVDYQIVPFDQYYSLLMTKLNTGECTDIFCLNNGRFDLEASFNVAKNALDLSNESWASKVDPLVAEELSVDGKLYGEPLQDVSAVWAVAYNKQVFEDLGLEIPTTYKEFSAVCDAILAAGKTPIYECVSDGWHQTLWFPETGIAAELKDADIVDKWNNNEATFAGNETLITVLDEIKDMADKGYWGDNYMSNTYADSAKNIASGEYVMTVANQGFAAEVHTADSSFPEENIGYFVMPLADNQELNVNPSGPSRFIYSGTANVEAAKQYLEFMASDDSLAYLTEKVGKFNKLPFSNAPVAYSENVKDFIARYPQQVTVLQTSVKYINPQWTDMGNDISAMLLNEMDAEEVLENVDKLRAEQASAAGDNAWS